jgi:hypothetical protein
MKEKDAGIKWFNTIFYPERRMGRAVRYEDGVLPRLRQEEVLLFTPWGPRYRWDAHGVEIVNGDKEIAVINFLANLLNEWQIKMPNKKFHWIFIGADLYGIKINGLPEKAVKQYFINLHEILKLMMPEVEFHLWSKFNEQAEIYRETVKKDFSKLISRDLLSRANKTAKAMGKGGNPADYLIERLAEAMLMEDTFRPIKISCVGRHKDEGVDYDLPRLYLLPRDLHAPWL